MSFVPDWQLLHELRQQFLAEGDPTPTPWNATALEQYDHTFGRRIYWKWDWVFSELQKVQAPWGVQNEPSVLVDFGCGTGVATECYLDTFGSKAVSKVQLIDRSPLSTRYSKEKIKNHFNIEIEELVTLGALPEKFTLLISHVLGELGDGDRNLLKDCAARAETVIWIEPGTPALSRKLIEIRELLLQSHTAIAPCPHSGACGVLSSDNSRHWCHFFAKVPQEAFTTSFWSEFSNRLRIDLRSLPVSYLVLQKGRRDFPRPAEKVLGRPRLYKGYGQFLTCTASGVTDVKHLKRNQPELFK